MRRWWAIPTTLIACSTAALVGCGGVGSSLDERAGASRGVGEGSGALGVSVAPSAATEARSGEELSLAVGAAARVVRASGALGAFWIRGVQRQTERWAAPIVAALVPRGMGRAGATVTRGLGLLARDGALVYEVRAALATDPASRGQPILVAATDGRVWLGGDVSGPVAAAGAVRAALRVEGVRQVDARLRWVGHGAGE